jgi:hypothetical protein
LQKREAANDSMQQPNDFSAGESLIAREASMARVSLPPTDGGLLLNASARAYVPAGGSMTVGFMLAGSIDRDVLVRAIGPSLSVFGIPNPIEAPCLEIYAGQTRRSLATAGWRGSPEIVTAAAKVGAFTIARHSNDAALVISLPAGQYTAVVKGMTAADCGDALIEIYEQKETANER